MRKLVLIIGLSILAGIAATSVWVLAQGRGGFGMASGARGERDCGGGVAGTQLGGPFALTAPDGSRVTSADLAGEPQLIYFGYTYCPDICPSELGIISEAAETLDATETPVRPVFITIDPERDTPEIMGEYASHFHPRMLALTGTPEEIAEAAKAFRVYYSPHEDPDFSDGYSMDHSSLMYLIGEGGEFITYFHRGTDPDYLAEATACYLG